MDDIEKNLISKPEQSSEDVESSVPESFEVIEISERQLQEYADVVKADMDQQVSGFLEDADRKIENATKGIGISPEEVQQIKQQEVEPQLNEIHEEAINITNESKTSVEAVIEGNEVIHMPPSESYFVYGREEAEDVAVKNEWTNWFNSELERTGLSTAQEYLNLFQRNIGHKFSEGQYYMAYNFLKDKANVEKSKPKKSNSPNQENKKTQKEKEATGKDTQEGADEVTENREKLNQEELKGLEKGFDDLTDSIQRLCVEIRERESDGLNTLIDQGNYSRLRGLSTKVESIFGKTNISAEELKQFIQGAASAIGEIGKERGGAKDDLDSLKKVSTFLNRIEDECVSVLNNLRGIKKEEAKVLIESVKRLRDKTGRAGDYISRKLVAMRRYLS